MNDNDQAVADIQQLLDAETTSWRPEPGSQIVGVVKAIQHRTSDWSKDYPILTIAPSDGSVPWVDVHAFHTVLWQEIVNHAPRIGDTVGIRYVGKQPGGAGESYELYKFALARTASSLEADGAQALQAPSSAPSDNGWGAAAQAGAAAAPADLSSGGRAPLEGSPIGAPVASGEGAAGAPGEPDFPAAKAQWQVLLELSGNTMQGAADRVNLANGTNYTRATVATATADELARALSP